MKRVLRGVVLVALPLLPFRVAFAWGDEGHEIVGEIATHYLQPAVRQKVFAMLAADTDRLTAHDFVSSTTWADRFRDSDRNGSKVHYLQTRQWHFTDIELADGNEDSACFGHPVVPPGSPASLGPPADCAADKVQQFAAELKSPLTRARSGSWPSSSSCTSSVTCTSRCTRATIATPAAMRSG